MKGTFARRKESDYITRPRYAVNHVATTVANSAPTASVTGQQGARWPGGRSNGTTSHGKEPVRSRLSMAGPSRTVGLMLASLNSPAGGADPGKLDNGTKWGRLRGERRGIRCLDRHAPWYWHAH